MIVPNLPVSRCECSWWSLSGAIRQECADPSRVAVGSFQMLEDVCSKQVSISLQELQSEVFNCLYLFMVNSSMGQPRNLCARSHCPVWCHSVRRDRVMFGTLLTWQGQEPLCQRCCSSASAAFLLAQASPAQPGPAGAARAQINLCNPVQQSLCQCWLYFRD